MKKSRKKIKVLLCILIQFVCLNKVQAEEITSQDINENNIWKTIQPIELITSDGISVDTEIESECEDYDQICWSGWIYIYNVKFTIPEDYEEEYFTISPDLFQTITNEGLNKVIMQQPSDFLTINITIVNNSLYEYNYINDSFTIYPDTVYQYKKVENQYGNATTFNGNSQENIDTVYRMCNSAIKALFPDCKKNPSKYLTDNVLGEALINNGYTKGISDLANYYLDFYNSKYSTSYNDLSQFSTGIIREILSDTDPIYNKNSAWDEAGIKGYISSANNEPTKYINNINDFLKNNNYPNAIYYLLKYYNNKYSQSASNLDELFHLSSAAQKDFFKISGSENSSKSVLESNATITALSYDFFYNNLLSFSFNNENQDDDNSNAYSIGEYMRNSNKGNEEITSNIGTLSPNTTNYLNGANIKINGHYTNNSYQDYNFNINMYLSYKALKGNLIVQYLDEDGNELAETITNEEMVGRTYNYNFIRVEGDATGKYIDGETFVTYIYAKKEETKESDNLKINLIDEPTNQSNIEIIPPKTGVYTNSMKKTKLLNLIINLNIVSYILKKLFLS
jgi:hypothetical protein